MERAGFVSLEEMLPRDPRIALPAWWQFGRDGYKPG
jgi:hypothetical protein